MPFLVLEIADFIWAEKDSVESRIIPKCLCSSTMSMSPLFKAIYKFCTTNEFLHYPLQQSSVAVHTFKLYWLSFQFSLQEIHSSCSSRRPMGAGGELSNKLLS